MTSSVNEHEQNLNKRLALKYQIISLELLH